MCLVDGAGVTEIVEDPEVATNVEITRSTAAEVAKIAGACPIVGTGIAEAVVVTLAAALLLLLLPPLPFVVVAVAALVNLTVNAEVLIAKLDTIVLVAVAVVVGEERSISFSKQCTKAGGRKFLGSKMFYSHARASE